MSFTQFLRNPKTAFSVFKSSNARNALEKSLAVSGIAHAYGIDKTKESLKLSEFEKAIQEKEYAAHFQGKRPLLNFINTAAIAAENNKGIFEFMYAAAKIILSSEDVLIYKMPSGAYSIVTQNQLTNEQCTALNLFSDLLFSLLKSNELHLLNGNFDVNELKGIVVFDSLEAGLNESALIGFISVLNLFGSVNFIFLGGFSAMIESYLGSYARNREDVGVYGISSGSEGFQVSKSENAFLSIYSMFDMPNRKSINLNIPTQVVKFDDYRYVRSYTTFGNLIELTTDINRAKHFATETLNTFAQNFELSDIKEKNGYFLEHKIVNPNRYNDCVIVVPF